MPNFETLRLLATESGPEVLDALIASGLSLAAAVEDLPEEVGKPLFDDFQRMNLVIQPDLIASTRAKICHCCIQAIEGGELTEVIDRLKTLDPGSNRISLVREGMTTHFLSALDHIGSIKRIMICSPWINLDSKRLRRLMVAVEQSTRRQGYSPEISVVTRPLDAQPGATMNDTLAYLQRSSAVIRWKPDLHSKLYVVESASSTPYRLAFVGSENFTKVRWSEIGLRIHNDNQLIDSLQRYFLDLLTT